MTESLANCVVVTMMLDFWRLYVGSLGERTRESPIPFIHTGFSWVYIDIPCDLFLRHTFVLIFSILWAWLVLQIFNFSTRPRAVSARCFLFLLLHFVLLFPFLALVCQNSDTNMCHWSQDAIFVGGYIIAITVPYFVGLLSVELTFIRKYNVLLYWPGLRVIAGAC